MTTDIPGITICPFTGLPIDPNNVYDVPNKMLVFGYSNKIIEKVEIPNSVYVSIYNKYLGKYKDYMSNLYIYIGTIRNHYNKYKTPFYVSTDFIDKGYKDYTYPKTFQEKYIYFLDYIYKNGGNEFKSLSFSSSDYPLAYANDIDEFHRIIEKLEQKGFIEILKKAINNNHQITSVIIRLTNEGEQESEKTLPPFPIWDIVKQEVLTGDTNIDDKILHAKKLFFKTDSTFNDKRSACETLSFVLEPIREDLKTVFSSKDVSDFFNIVNSFDIRHNKETTKSIEHEEQLEWIFYSLLNSIICYYKLWKK